MGIFKNEEPTLRATFESVGPFVEKFALIDTGSADKTFEIIEEQAVKHKLKGQGLCTAFVDYATTRNRALDLARSTMSGPNALFTLMLSADEVLEGGEALRKFLTEYADDPQGAYCVTVQSGTRQWPYTRVLRNDGAWKYVGKVHERPVGPKGEVEAPHIPGVRIIHRGTDHERKAQRLREFDLPVLEAEVLDDSKTPEERAHPLYFLAETLSLIAGPKSDAKKAGDWKYGEWMSLNLRAMGYYFRYAQLAEQVGSTAQDIWKAHYAMFMYFHLADETGVYTSEEMLERLKVLCSVAPRLPEAHFLRAKHACLIDTRTGLQLAVDSAKVAHDVLTNPGFEVVDNRLEWLSYRLAAYAAKESQMGTLAKNLAEKCIAAGGPPSAVDGL